MPHGWRDRLTQAWAAGSLWLYWWWYDFKRDPLLRLVKRYKGKHRS